MYVSAPLVMISKMPSKNGHSVGEDTMADRVSEIPKRNRACVEIEVAVENLLGRCDLSLVSVAVEQVDSVGRATVCYASKR